MRKVRLRNFEPARPQCALQKEYVKEEYVKDMTEPRYTLEQPLSHNEAFYKLLVA